MSLKRLAALCAGNPWKVVIAWVVALVIFGGLQGIGLNSTPNVELENNPESVQGWSLLEETGMRPERPGTESILLRADPARLNDGTFRTAVDQFVQTLLSDETGTIVQAVNYFTLLDQQSPEAANLIANPDKDGLATILIPVTLKGDLQTAVEDADNFLGVYDRAKEVAEQAGFTVMTVGDASLNDEINRITEEDIAQGESIGGMLAFIILLVVFGALVAAFVPIVLAAIAIVIALGITTIFSQAMELSFFVESMIQMIGLAVGIDYSLFVVQRYREERRHGMGKLDAIALAGSTASRAVLFSGLTVVVALAGMLIVPNNIYRSLAIGAIFVVVVAVIATLTLLPAVISLLGNKLDWPRRWKYDAETVAKQNRYDHETIHSGFWGTLTRIVMRRPIIALVLAVGFLVLCALPYFNLNPGLGGASQLPDELEGKQAYNVLAENFQAGRIAPVEIVIDGAVSPDALNALKADIADETTSTGAPLFGPISEQKSADGQVTLLSVPLNVAPDDEEGYDAIGGLRAKEIDGGTIYVTGMTANNFDFFAMRDTYTPIVFAFVLGLSFLLLMTVFRSIVVAVKAILMNLLSVGAAYGLLVWVFQEGHLTDLFGFQQLDAIEAWLPLFLFSVLFGLSMDYHVFLLSRIREHFDESTRNAESVAVGLQATARIITGAALIMVAVFGGFASGRIYFMQQMGFGLGVAVLLDATIVRSILVPAAMALLGDRNWYLPRWLHWLPDLRVEASKDEPVLPAPAVAPAD